jgi:hypothetical protein
MLVYLIRVKIYFNFDSIYHIEKVLIIFQKRRRRCIIKYIRTVSIISPFIISRRGSKQPILTVRMAVANTFWDCYLPSHDSKKKFVQKKSKSYVATTA